MEKEKYTQLTIYDFLNEEENEKVYKSKEKMLKKIQILESRIDFVKDEKVVDATRQLIEILKNKLK